MKRNSLPNERLNESLSKKGVTFSEESSLLYYTTEGTVDSLNNSAIHTVYNPGCSSSPENSGKFKNFFDFCDKYISDQCLNKLPEARVVLERLPEALLPTYSESTGCSQECNAAKTTDLFMSKNVAEPVKNRNNQRLKENKYPLQDSEAPSADKYKNCIGKEVFPGGCSTVESCSQNFDCVASKLKVKASNKTKSKKLSQKLHEKSSVLQNKNATIKQNTSLQNSIEASLLFIESKTFECVSKSKREHKECIEFVDYIASVNNSSRKDWDKISFDKYPCVHLEKLNLEPYLKSSSNFFDTMLNKKNVPMDIELEVGNTTKMLNDLSVSEKNVTLTEKASSKTIITPKTDKKPAGNIFTKETYSSSNVLRGLPLNNLPKESRNVSSVMSNHKNDLQEASILQNKNIVNCKENKNSNYCKSAQNVYPCVLLERLNLFPIDVDKSDSMNSPEPVLKDLVPSVSNDPDLPIQIAKVCSISKKKFDKVQKYNNLSKNKRKVQDYHSYFNQLVKHQNTNLNIRKPKSLQLSSFNAPASSSNNSTCIYTSSDSTSDDTSSEDIHLTSFSKQNNHSFHNSKALSDDEISLINFAKSKANLPIGMKTKNKRVNSKIQNDSTKRKNSLTPRSVSNKVQKSKKFANSSKPKVEKTNSKKFLRKKQKKMYKMIMKYLKKQIKAKKHKKKAKKRKNHSEKLENSESRMLVSPGNDSDSESNDSIAVIYDSVDKQNNSIDKDSFQKDKLPAQSKSMSRGESSSKSNEIKKAKKLLLDKYRLGFLSKKNSLRFYNKLLASERLLLSKSKMKKKKKKELKKLFNKLKAVGLLSYK